MTGTTTEQATRTEPARRTRRDTPPRVGPYGRVEQVGGRWVVRLTAEGQSVYESFVAEWPQPHKLIARYYRSTLVFAIAAGMSHADIDAAAREGVARAVIRWEPESGRLANYGTWWVRNSVQRAAHRLSKGWRLTGKETLSEKQVAGESESIGAMLLVPAKYDPDADPAERERRTVVRERVADAMRKIPARYRDVFELRYGLADGREKTLQETGDIIGISRERVRQICHRVKVRLVEDLEAVWLDHCRGEVAG